MIRYLSDIMSDRVSLGEIVLLPTLSGKHLFLFPSLKIKIPNTNIENNMKVLREVL